MMQTIELIGQVAADFLKRSIQTDEANEGVARFLLNRLTAQQVAEVCRTILQDSKLAPLIKIQVPRDLVGGCNLPDEILTDERTVHLRHSACDRPALLLANSSDDQSQSLNDITSISAQELKGQIECWIDLASKDLAIPDEQIDYWHKALRGLQKVGTPSLENFAEFIVQTRSRILDQSLPVVDALGWALPALRLPRDSAFFRAIPETQWGQTQRWEKLFQQAFSKRACLLLKQTPSRKPIDEQDLQTAFDKVKEDIPENAHPIIQSFISSAAGWNTQAEALAQFEWESDNINTLFSGLKTQKTDIASLTLDFFNDEFPDTLTEEELQYLNALKKRNKREALDEDREFYDAHRQELEGDRKLKAKWDKFVYGQPIECTDFMIGLLQAFERLFDQAENVDSVKSLKIETQKKAANSKWLELNADVGRYFCTRYRGIEQLTAPHIQWETHWLFKYETLIEKTKKKQGNKYRENTSTAKTATELKFYVEMRDSAQALIAKTQLVWRCNPNAIGMELSSDIARLLNKSPFQLSTVARELVSKKGRLQGISLSDVGTLMATYSKDRGSLIGKYENKDDLAKILPKQLKQAVAESRLSKEGSESITAVWKTFSESYRSAIAGFTSAEGQGISNPELLHQCDAYETLLKTVLTHVKGDLNRIDLYQPILRLGCIRIERGKPAAIIAPWHPLRLASLAIKARQLAGLLRYIISTPEVNFGDSRLFFADLRDELDHPYYPEVCVGYQGQQPELLSVSDTVNDYSLMERPTRDESDRTTNENPAEAADRLLGIIRRYVELLPHEKTNLSVVLYQNDSIKLPQAIVNKLSEELQDDREEVRCQVILRHRNGQKLTQLYEQMLESSDADPDAFIASEVSQDFMARLRISVMSNDVPPTNSREGKFADIVFLQDAISRQAAVVWQPSPFSSDASDLLTHSPARWSRKRPSATDELKSTVYLTCPKQPIVGQVYLDLVYSTIRGEDCSPDQHFLPARQISFQDETTKTTFDESHRLGEWVVNYDDLLERRQLVNQGVKVIRYQQHRTDERNFLVSSDASLNVLKVLVRKRLGDLNLALENDRIDKLVERLINDANTVSGDIVLRAAKCGRFASELMGVVLSKALITAEMGVQNPIGWYFLDDYASWLGQKEGQIADIMAISPQYIGDEPVLKVIIAEAKYINVAGLADARKTSQNQLRQTVDRIADALFISPGRLDRDLWLSRLSDLLLDGIEFSSNNKVDIEQWREQIRSGTLRIDLSGYSHVFVTGTNDSNVEGERSPIPKVERCFQEVFDRESVRKLVLAYESGQSLFPIREQIGDDRPWKISQALPPAERVTWVLEIEKAETVTPKLTAAKEDKLENVVRSNPQPIRDELANPVTSDSPAISVTENPDNWASPSLSAWCQQGQAQNSQNDTAAEKWLEETAGKLRTALLGYNLQAKIEGTRLTPNAAIVRFKGSDNLKLDDIEKKRSQLLTTHSLNVISLYGQPGEIVVSVARPQRQTISLREVWEKRKVNQSPSGVNLSFVLGVKEIDGELLYLNLGGSFENLEQHAPHTLIAGATGSGKSVLLQNLLLDICATNSTKLAQIYLIDPKMGVDYANISDLPHLKEGIIIEQDRAIEILEFLVEEMDNRYRKFLTQKAKSLQDYNCKVPESDRLPVLWLVHDEFAEWMLVDEYKAAVSTAVQRLGVKARAAGIYLIFAAQRPDANVLPVQLRDNLGNRLILRVESVGTSEISLGQKGAENLLGKGHLAARLTNQSDLIYAQVPFLGDEDMATVAEIIKQQGV